MKRPSDTHRADTLARINAAIQQCGRHPTEEEIREAARRIDAEDYLPDPQLDLIDRAA